MSVQGTAEWLLERCGKVTASRVCDVMSKGRGSEPSTARRNYLAQLVAERLTMQIEPTFTNAAMQWGTDNEPIARACYEMAKEVMVDQVGFVPHPMLKWAGASPDGLVGDVGLVEFKCPNTATHIDYLLAGEVPPKYKPQMAWQIICAEREWCDFASFDPRMPDDMQLFIVRYNPSLEYLREVSDAVNAFLLEVESTIAKLKEVTNGKAL